MIRVVETVYTDKPIDATSRLVSGSTPVADCSTSTPPWLDDLSRRLGGAERVWMSSRIASLAIGIAAGTATRAERSEHARLEVELHTGFRASLSRAVTT